MSYEQYLFYTAQLSQMFGISSLPPLQPLALRSSRTSDDLDQLASNDGLTSTVVENLELVDHVTGVLGGVVHGVLARGLLASVALSKCLRTVSVLFARPCSKHTQKSELARAYSRRLGRASSSISKAE